MKTLLVLVIILTVTVLVHQYRHRPVQQVKPVANFGGWEAK